MNNVKWPYPQRQHLELRHTSIYTGVASDKIVAGIKTKNPSIETPCDRNIKRMYFLK